MDSALTDWLSGHLDQDDLILTPEYSMNEVTMSGVMMYLGWPYYAWSAGYDTYGRAQKAVEIYTSEDGEAVRELVKQEKITYILYEEGMEFEGNIRISIDRELIPWYISLWTGEYEYMKHETAKK